MTPLRQRMTEDMQLVGYSSKTQQADVGAVRQLFAHFNCNSAQLPAEQLRQYFLYLANERKVSRCPENLLHSEPAAHSSGREHDLTMLPYSAHTIPLYPNRLSEMY